MFKVKRYTDEKIFTVLSVYCEPNFHQTYFLICFNEMDDCVVRMADLIKEGYSIESITNDPRFVLEVSSHYSEPSIHITLQKGENLR